jgi:hypothetical protein
MNIDWNNPWIQGILVGVVATIIAAVITFIFNKLKSSGESLVSFLARNQTKKSGLELYRETLEKETLYISHPWMKQEQTLNEILIDINFEAKGATSTAELKAYLQEVFGKKKAPRILILGKPGSGKSIAIRVIAKVIWESLPNIKLVPIILSFSDIKGLASHEEMKKKMVEKLQYFQFEKGKSSSTAAEDFVEAHMFSGGVLLLFDGYDELDKSNREVTRNLLRGFLGTYRDIPVVISSRDAVYERELPFENLVTDKVHMAPFTPFAVLKFLSQWKFEGRKSAQDLFQMINGKAHLSELASNPLMLTIVAFLYSLPKYTLPDNRVQFYDQCTRALLEEWDKTRDVNRANIYESHQKIAILSHIAFDHVSIASETDEFISEDKIHEATRAEMKRLSLKEYEYSIMTNEIVQNSGLLQFIPPSEYRFPHRTFMEFFAASYINQQKDANQLIELFEKDPERWKQTLLLYLGLNKNKDFSYTILEKLRQDFVGSWNDQKPRSIVFDALTECAVPDPKIASEVLDLAQKFLTTKRFASEIVEQMGYIAANPRWAYAATAKHILTELLDKERSDDNYQKLIFALLHIRDESINDTIVKSIKRIKLASIFSNLGRGEISFIHKLLAVGLSDEEKSNIINGLMEAGNLDALRSLLIENSDTDIKELSALALLRMSNVRGFQEFLENTEINLVERETGILLTRLLRDWGWRWKIPASENGRKMIFLICHTAANRLSKMTSAEKQIQKRERTLFLTANFHLQYLTLAFVLEGNPSLRSIRLVDERVRARPSVLRKYWQVHKDPDNNLRYKLGSWLESQKFIILITMWIPYVAVSLLGIWGMILKIFGLTFVKSYGDYLNDFTVYFLFFQFLISSLLALAILYREESLQSWFLALLMGPLITVVMMEEGVDEEDKFINRFGSLVFLALCLVTLFIPLRHFAYSILLGITWLLTAIWISDETQVNFAFIFTDRIHKVLKALRTLELK